ncbi:hypothetical protein DRH27_03840, partial [Candidatus Falkowbacteria bacterium]
MTILQNGNFGIGSTTPYYKLGINGSLYATDIYTSSSTFYMDSKPVMTQGQVRMYQGSNYAGFKASSSLATDLVWALPIADGSPAQVLTTYGDGSLYWTTNGSGAGTVNTGEAGQLAYYETGTNAVSGTSSIFIMPDGKVGIGTTSPDYNLHISSVGDSALYLEADSDDTSGTDNSFIKFTQDGGTTGFILGLTGADGVDPENNAYIDALSNSVLLGAYNLNNDAALQLGTVDAVRMTIDINGYVGIGTTTPAQELNVYGDVFVEGPSRYLYFGTTTADGAYGIRDSGGTMQYRNNAGTWENLGSGVGSGVVNTGDAGQIAYYETSTNQVKGTSSLFIMPDGYVGIGTTSPDALLHIVGNGENVFERLTWTDSSNYGSFNFYEGETVMGSIDVIGSNYSNASIRNQVRMTAFKEDLGSISFLTNTGGTYYNRLHITNVGRVGISSSSPDSLLTLYSDGSKSGPLLHVASTSVEALYIDATGNIGMGTDNPSYLLDITGSSTDYMASIYNTNTGATSSGLYIRSDGTSGNLLTLNSGGSDIVTISEAASVFNNPVQFGSSGDVAMAYDLIFTNDSAGNINFQGPGYIQTDSAYENLDLTLMAANNGDVVISDTAVITGTTTIADTLYVNAYTDRVGIGTSTPTALLALEGTAGTDPFSIASSTGSSLFYINEAGKVGIGSTTLTHNLEVNGSIYADDVYTASSSFYMAGLKVLTLTSHKMYNDGSYVGFAASSALATDLTWYLPTVVGASGQALTSDGLGNLYWANSAGSISDLSDTNISGPSDGDLLVYDSGTGKWLDVATNTLEIALSDTTGTLDVNRGGTGAVTLSSGDILLGNGTGGILSTSTLAINKGGTGATTAAGARTALNVDIAGTDNSTEVSVAAGKNYISESSQVLTLGAISLSGTGDDLDVTGTLGLANGGTGATSFTSGSIVFSNGTALTHDNSNFYWDDTNKHLGIGTTTSSAMLSIKSSADTQFQLAYSDTLYADITVDSNGYLTFDTSGGAQSAVLVGTGASEDTGLIFNSDTNDFYMGVDDTTDQFFIGTSTTVGENIALTILANGNVGIGSTTPGYILSVAGDSNSTGAWYTNGSDYAEFFYTDDINLEAGETVCVDVGQENAVKRCDRGSDGNVMGIVSTHPSIVGNNQFGYNDDPNYVIVGMLGQVPAKVSAENGSIRPGDSLTSASSTPGYAMRANPGDPTVGVALEGLDEGEGVAKVLISRRNKSLTVELVESRITQHIAEMEIEDEVEILLSQAIEDYNIASSVTTIVDDQINAFDKHLTVAFNTVDNELLKVASSVDAISSRLLTLETNLGEIDHRISTLEAAMEPGSGSPEPSSGSPAVTITEEGNIKLGTVSAYDASSTEPDVAIVEIVTSTTTDKTAFVVNQVGQGNIADFQFDGISVVNIAETGRVSVVGEMTVDGRLMVCSGGGCGLALDEAVDETMGDMGVEGKLVAGAFESYCADGYVWVPGLTKYGTMPGFCVSASEARLEDEHGSSSTPVWVNVTQGEAKLACQEVGEDYHLITENEWLTIADNVIRTAENDIDLISDGLQLPTASLFNEASSSIALALTNSNIIYDLIGGVSEWTDRVVTKAGLIEPLSEDWQEYWAVEDYNGFNIAPPYYYTSDNGIGRVKSTDNENSLRGLVRGTSAIYDLDLSY